MNNKPYNPIQKAGDMYYLSGVVGINTMTNTAEPDFNAQVYRAFDNLEAALATKGLELADIVKTTVFLIDMDDYDSLNRAYLAKFPTQQQRPARTCVAVAELPRVGSIPFKVEIEAIAVSGGMRP